MKLISHLLKFLKESRLFLWFFFFISIALILFAVFLIYWKSPDDYLQGDLVKIMYIHVPFAWISMILYTSLSLFSLMYLIKKIIFFDVLSKNIAQMLLLSVVLTLATGSIWGKPAWGTWWVWDARLTSMLILFFITFSYILVRSIFNNEELAAKIGAITAIVGFLNIPIIKFSVDFWSTLHQKSTFLKSGGPSIHSSMVYPTIIMFFGIMILISITIASKIKLEILEKKLKRAN